ncbi:MULTISPECIES: outer membrane protein assembly factor [Duncaniella]|mgnify:FL=1|jgi:outer membrane protein insertion porin family|nr:MULTISPECIES: POTRA domain-containing protein [Duncaniella]NBH92539.1 outer membrane protein assembly factor BamA [Muribaculaceae bacterium S4]NBI20971.1 outer membrane protein assembly factor BamA [Muribaculaceae bacterium Z1]ROS90902.1 outer membrane protein assembly factor BamA [Muribaculaceae bacterium Isolate-039 (Harlan)]ROS96866.1 outer membrane protein assembly factor BamA [Muribaculaceae bacterium Isolate-083 (Janvier)]ROS98069.1 outer membrane protein assembly factor BamA [Muribac
MRFRFITFLLFLSALTANVCAQAPADTVYNPDILFTGLPKTYEIADIQVKGADNYEDYIVIGYTGLKVGDLITIPSAEITDASKRLWRQGLFSKVQIAVDKVIGNKAYLTLNLRQQPRISEINYHGVKKGEKQDLEEALQLMKGNQITQNIVNRAESIIKKYYSNKGFGNAVVKINLTDDLSHPNEVIVDININKNDKVKVHKIYIDGNNVLSDRQLQRVMKKTNEKGKLINLFRQKKFVETDYKDDLNRIIQKYNEKGYRDAVILSDSVVPYDEKTVDVYINLDEGKRYFVNDVTWVGNTVYPTENLAALLGIEKGDVYNQTLLKKRTTDDDDAIASAYMDNGYLFFDIVPVEKNVRGDSIDLEMRIVEGPQARINNVIINGNDRLYEKVIRRELRVKPGELFSKSDLMRSAREIAQTGHFNPENMDIRPEPNQENGTVDILFNLESKSNDQFEFSMGWGQTGIIGKVAIKFTNFSIKNLFYPNSYKGLVPQGDGQQLTISAQTNARYYQAYSISFLDPWFGGKRPNSLSVSAWYSRQTGVNSSYYNRNYMNNYLYSYSGLYNTGYGYDNNYSYENAYDPNKFLQMIGVSVGFGKRLNWPDDYFTFQAELGYSWYYLKNWEYLYYMQNGTSNALTIGLTLARNSIDNPLYTRSGSNFSLNLQLTPPVSLFGNKNWKKLSEENTTAAKKELYRWIEYWKLRFKARTYTPINDVESKYTLVLMTRADIGLLGSYNKYLKSPFETFYVGGDGMSGSYTYAQETIALRGYDNGQLTPYQLGGGYAYTRFGMELHFPFMLQPTTTIYGLTFIEGGNAWTSVKNFSPFELKRSAGVGVRIYLPMIGMMGIDWAYGFDKVYGTKGGSHFHFILGQEF